MPTRRSTRPRSRSADAGAASLSATVKQLSAIERDGGDGTLTLPDGVTLDVSSLDKPYFPDDGITKGGVMRYYVRLANGILPAIADRPLVLRRYPAGINGPFFFQHDPGDSPPNGVRVESVVPEPGSAAERRFVGAPLAELGAALATLLHTVQLGAILVNVWHSRIGSIEHPDYAVLDLDPDPKAGFARVVAVARAVHAELDRRALPSVPKTSGSRGIHMLIPLPAGATYDESAALAEDIATAVARQHPRIATVERALGDRPRGSVYVDHMQNASGKTLVAAFSLRAKAGAPVSTPLTWSQVSLTLDPAAYSADVVVRRKVSLVKRWLSAMSCLRNSTV